MIICETCRQEVDPENPDVLTAYEQVDVTGFQAETREYQGGMRVCFHRACFPFGNPSYRAATD